MCLSTQLRRGECRRDGHRHASPAETAHCLNSNIHAPSATSYIVCLTVEPAIVCIARRPVLCDPVCPSVIETAQRNPQPDHAPRVGWGDGCVFPRPNTGFSARAPLLFLPASPLSRKSPNLPTGIPAVATSWKLGMEWSAVAVASANRARLGAGASVEFGRQRPGL